MNGPLPSLPNICLGAPMPPSPTLADPCDELMKAASSFFRAAIQDTFLSLGMDVLLVSPQSPAKVAQELGLHEGAATRFLFAAANVGLVTYTSPETFQTHHSTPHYSNALARILFWLVHNRFSHFLAVPRGIGHRFDPTSELTI